MSAPDPYGAKMRKVGILFGGRATARGAAHRTTLLNEVRGVDPAVAGQMTAVLPNRCFRHFLKPRMDANERESEGKDRCESASIISVHLRPFAVSKSLN